MTVKELIEQLQDLPPEMETLDEYEISTPILHDGTPNGTEVCKIEADF